MFDPSRLRLIAAVTAACVAVAAHAASASGVVPRFEATACWPAVPAGAHARCGYLVVPENRRKHTGKTIRVAVAIIPASAKAPDAAPLVYLDGGPGGAPIFSAGLAVSSGLDADRDLILVDQRGTYYSQPQLTCPKLDAFFSRLLGLVYDADSTRKAHVAATRAAGRTWRRKASTSPPTTRRRTPTTSPTCGACSATSSGTSTASRTARTSRCG